jgi:hypothetical protein
LGEKVSQLFHQKELNKEFDLHLDDSKLKFFSTYHPKEMLQKPDLKKTAWQGFQTIMGNLPK